MAKKKIVKIPNKNKIDHLITGGYQPTQSKLDAKNPPKGGSGVRPNPPNYSSESDSEKE